jgi:hypothetical protein
MLYVFLIESGGNMKKLAMFFGVLFAAMLIPATAYADSPITSTSFSDVYQDFDIVIEAKETGAMNEEIAQYLYQEDNPIDVKAAVINAMSFNWEGPSNADTYCQLIYGKSLSDITMEELRGDQLFCIGYMIPLNDYSQMDASLEFLDLAAEKLPKSFTVAIVRALVASMNMTDHEWEEHIEPVLNDTSLIMDMRKEGLDIITAYMFLYGGLNSNPPDVEEEEIPETGVTSLSLLFGIGALASAAVYRLQLFLTERKGSAK